MKRYSVHLIVLALVWSINASVGSAATAVEALPSLSPMLERVGPGVVNVSVRGRAAIARSPLFRDPLFRHFFNFPGPAKEHEVQSVGSGVIIDAEDGYVVTNHHLIVGAEAVSVVLNDGRRLEADVVGSDSQADVAVLEIQADNLTAVPFGNSDDLKIGDFVVAIGNPFGIGQTATLGIVSALGRSGLGISDYENHIQTDAAINPGNSGGALVDQEGRLIGINTAIMTRGGANIGIGFAIPVNTVRSLVDQILTYGEARRGRLGVQIQDLTPDLAEALRIDADGGALVSRVFPGTAAEEAGVHAGDAIVALEGRAVESSAELRNQISLMEPGRKVELTIVRKGQRRTLDATLGVLGDGRVGVSDGASPLAGALLVQIPPDHPLHGQIDGVLVHRVDPVSEAARAGLRAGDVIVSANHQSITSLSGLSAIARNKGDKPLLLKVQRGGSALFLAIR